MSDPDAAAIRYVVASPIAELILNRPEKRNALNADMWACLPDLVARANDDPSVKAIIVHGGDTGAFAAGADISEFDTIYATPESAEAFGATIAAALEALETSPKPTIAAVDGVCVGGGVSLAMACDLRFGSVGSKYGVTPAKLGLVYPAGDTRRLMQAIGPGATKDLLFTGRIFDADTANEMNLIDRLILDVSAIGAARLFAAEIAKNSQWSIRAIKTMILGLQSGWTDADPRARALFADGFSNIDFEDGHKAFVEKRPPKFTFE